jgi:hypothetical protein
MKKLLIGFIIGMIVSCSVVFAANKLVANVADFPVLIDGNEYKPVNPMIVVNNTSYISSRDVGKILGKSIIWNDSLKRIEFGESTPSYKSGDLKFTKAGIGVSDQLNDKSKPQNGNCYMSILVKVTNTGSEAACFNKNEFCMKTLDGKEFSAILAPTDRYPGINLCSRESSKVGLLFEIPKDDIFKKREVILVYRPAKSEDECKIPINLTMELD